MARKSTKSIGDKFGMLVIKQIFHKKIKNRIRLICLCECECGNFVEKLVNNLSVYRHSSCGCKPTNTFKSWSEQDIKFLIQNYSIKGTIYCCEHLNRTEKSINLKAMRLGINTEAKHNRPKDIPVGYDYCGSCKQILPEFDFRGKNSKIKYNTYICKSCLRKMQREHYYKNKNKILNKKHLNPEKTIYQMIKQRANREKIAFNLTIEDIKIPNECPVLKIPIIPFSASDNSPSVDRLVPEKGYTKNNICIISKRANTLKNNATSDEIQKVLDWMKLKNL